MTDTAQCPSSLVFSHGNQAVTSTLIIAQETGNEHASVIKLVRDYRADFEEFGPCRFEIAKGQALPQGGFAKATEFALLNQEQSTLLLTYMRNSDIVRAFKKRLVKAFFEFARQAPAFSIPKTFGEALKLAAEQQFLIEHQQAQLEAAQPAIEFHERVAVAEDCHSIDEAAKILQAPPRKFRNWLKQSIGMFRLDGNPKQEFIDRGYVRVIEKTIQLPHGWKLYAQTYITGKGMQWLQRKLDHSLLGVEG